MYVYTVFEPPHRAADDAADSERFRFVRDGFSVWAFLLGPLWMLWHRLWLVLFCYLILMAAIDTAMAALGASSALIFLIAFLLSVLVGLEASTLRRFTLSRRSWKYIGVASGADREAAEVHFFDAWVREASAMRDGDKARLLSPLPAGPRPPAGTVPRMPQAHGVIGLFPEPGAQR
jgi:Protein of unknown function (DUF2628)